MHLRLASLTVFATLTISQIPAHAQRLQNLPVPGRVQGVTLVTEATDRDQLVLTLQRGQVLAMQPYRAIQEQYWVLSPVDRNVVRLQLFASGRFWSLVANGPGNRITMERSAQRADQLWRMVPSLAVQGAVRFESAAYPGRYLAGHRDSRVSLERAGGSPAQNWFVDTAQPPNQVVIPSLQLVQHSVRPLAPLPPVKTALTNSRDNEVWVVLTDLRNGTEQHLKIPARDGVEVELQRDSGAAFVESYQVTSALGNVYREEFSTSVPPATLYEITVYERFLQSIAIDRTGKSPNRIEDINYQPRSIGVFLIPAGDQFQGGRLEVYELAKQQNNAGGVRPIKPENWEGGGGSLDPLEQALRDAKR